MKKITDFTKLKVGEYVIEKELDGGGKEFEGGEIFVSLVIKIVNEKMYESKFYGLDINNEITHMGSGETERREYIPYRLTEEEQEEYKEKIIFFELGGGDKDDEEF